MKVAIDIGGTLSKYPNQFRILIESLKLKGHKVYLLTDMDEASAHASLAKNKIVPEMISVRHVLFADFSKHGEAAKAVIMREKSIDVLIDDHQGYLVWPWSEPAPLRLAVAPDPFRPYHSPLWDSGDGFWNKAFTNEDSLGKIESGPSRIARALNLPEGWIVERDDFYDDDPGSLSISLLNRIHIIASRYSFGGDNRWAVSVHDIESLWNPRFLKIAYDYGHAQSFVLEAIEFTKDLIETQQMTTNRAAPGESAT